MAEGPQDKAEDKLLFTTGQIRAAFTMSVVGMLGLLTVLFALPMLRPQGSLQPADDSRYRAHVREAAANLEGFDRVGETRARIDIRHAIELVAERGVDLELVHVASEVGEPATDATAGDDAPAADAQADADGAAVYAANCAGCHQAQGQGVPGAFPPLAGDHVVALASNEAGRDYLVRALLYGVQGPLTVAGNQYDGMMPPWPQLSDDEIAAVLNHLVLDLSGGEVDPFGPANVADARDLGLSSAEVLDLRPDLD